MNDPQPYELWRLAKASLRRVEFEERYPQLFLLWAPLAAGETPVPPPGRVEFNTMMAKATLRPDPWPGPGPGTLTEPQQLLPAVDPPEPLILPLVKAKDNPFPDRISIGRAPNCDLVIRESSVSKLHGHFRDVTLESAEFTDARSSNGTRVNGVLLASGTPVHLKSLDQIILGRVRLRLLNPSDLYLWL